MPSQYGISRPKKERLRRAKLLDVGSRDAQPFNTRGEAGFGVGGNNGTAQADVGGRHVELGGQAGKCGFHDAIDSASNDALVRPGHADIALEGRATSQDALVGRGDVSVRAEDGGNAAIEVAAHDLHFAGRFGVEVDEPNAHFAGDCREDAVGRLPGDIDRPHEELAEKTGNGHWHAVRRRYDGPIAADRFWWQVCRLHDVRFGFQHGIDFLATIDMVAERDGIDARTYELAVDRGCKPRTAGGVFGVGHDEVELLVDFQTWYGCRDDVASGFANDVADEENSHGAGCWMLNVGCETRCGVPLLPIVESR